MYTLESIASVFQYQWSKLIFARPKASPASPFIKKSRKWQKGKKLSQRNICPVINFKKFLVLRACVEVLLFVHSDKSTLTGFQYNSVLRKTLLTNNHLSAWKSHSFRTDGAKCLAIKGLLHDKIQLLGIAMES